MLVAFMHKIHAQNPREIGPRRPRRNPPIEMPTQQEVRNFNQRTQDLQNRIKRHHSIPTQRIDTQKADDLFELLADVDRLKADGSNRKEILEKHAPHKLPKIKQL